MDITRSEKRVHFIQHFFDRVIEKKLFSSTERAKNITIRAIKRGGVLVPYEKEDSNCLCIFMGDEGVLVVTPLIETDSDFICRTVFKAEDWHKKIYKEKNSNIYER